jgi:hypothetical protein
MLPHGGPAPGFTNSRRHPNPAVSRGDHAFSCAHDLEDVIKVAFEFRRLSALPLSMAFNTAMNDGVSRRIPATTRRCDEIFRESYGLGFAVPEDISKQADGEGVKLRRAELC